MSYVVLARKYRPQTFAEVYAQEHITDILQNAIKSNRIHHAYLFNGPRGVGKTSLARILAKSLNCIEGPTITPCNKCSNCLEITSSTSTDVIEIDGASNNGVDDIRDLQEELMYAAGNSKYKIYIIDEVHMLSKNAFNALLKTLEEPPEYVVFIFATTEPHKVLPTIISRCQRYDFKRIPVESIVSRLKDLAVQEHISIDNESLYLIARKADGGLRDALSLMDQVVSYCSDSITIEQVRSIFGILPNVVFSNILRHISNHDAKSVVDDLHSIFELGTDLQELMNNMLEFLRLVLMRKIQVNPGEISKDEYHIYDEIAGLFSRNSLMYIISSLAQTKIDVRSSANPVLMLEVLLIKLSRMDEMDDISQLITKLNNMPLAQNISSPKPLTVGAPISGNPLSTANHIKTSAKEPAQKEIIAPSEPVEPENKIDLTMDSLLESWSRIVNRVAKNSKATSISLSSSKILAVQSNRIDLMITGSTSFDAVQKNKDMIESIINEFFGTKVILKLSLSDAPPPTSVNIKRETIDDIKAQSPEIASYIDITKSKINYY